jgi:nitrile hydratase accessory protein
MEDPSHRPDPVFDSPWHAQVFALVVHLNERGLFTWPDWVARFSSALRQAGLSQALNGGDDYFAVWLDTLEQVMLEQGLAGVEDLTDMKRAWERAYVQTPHGEPVHLEDPS